MLKIYYILLLLLIGSPFGAFAAKPFRFALLTDLHISATNHQATEDLQNAVMDVNKLSGIDFVIVSGDVSHRGDTLSLRNAKQTLEKLKMPFYIVSGNHDVKWYETGSVNFNAIFQDNKFVFTHNDIEFIGFTTAPLNNTGVGYIQPGDINWMKSTLRKAGKEKSVIVITHYPLQNGDVQNYDTMIDILLHYNVQAVLGGHYHRNVVFNYEGIPGVINRSTLRGNEAVGGYSIYSISDSIRVYEKKINMPEEKWLTLPFERTKYTFPHLKQ